MIRCLIIVRRSPIIQCITSYFGENAALFKQGQLVKLFHIHATWDVIETPGHAIDHLAFLNRETGQLFTGDLYCQEMTKVILREESIPTIIESLKRVLTF